MSESSILPTAQAFRDALAGVDPGRCSGDDAATIAEALARTEKVCAAARVRFAARAADCGAHQDRGHSNASEWIARETGGSAGRARLDV